MLCGARMRIPLVSFPFAFTVVYRISAPYAVAAY